MKQLHLSITINNRAPSLEGSLDQAVVELATQLAALEAASSNSANVRLLFDHTLMQSRAEIGNAVDQYIGSSVSV